MHNGVIKYHSKKVGIMKLSSRAVYGIRACALIAAEEKTPVSLPTLSEKAELSEKYLEQILSSLVKGGVLVSTRGASGGYSLAGSAEDISLYDILVAVDDAFEIGCGSSLEAGCGKKCGKYCRDKSTFENIEKQINEIFRISSLASVTHGREDI